MDDTDRVEKLQALVEADPEDALGRFMLGSELLKRDRAREAVTHLRRAHRLDPEHSATFRELGKALLALGESTEAARMLEQGIERAKANGDLQTAREMEVWLKRARTG